MSVRVLFFSLLSDKAGTSETEVNGVTSLDTLLQQLKNNYPFLNDYRFLIAKNQEIVKANVPLADGDEIALMPPFAGG